MSYKILTFTTLPYLKLVHNFYLQLKKFNLNDKYVIYCDNQLTAKHTKDILPDCEIHVYKPSVPVPNELIELFNSTENEALGPLNKKYTYINFAKHDLPGD